MWCLFFLSVKYGNNGHIIGKLHNTLLMQPKQGGRCSKKQLLLAQGI